MRVDENLIVVGGQRRDPWDIWKEQTARRTGVPITTVSSDFIEEACAISRFTGASFATVKTWLLKLHCEAWGDS
jgi:hypothetical protein